MPQVGPESHFSVRFRQCFSFVISEALCWNIHAAKWTQSDHSVTSLFHYFMRFPYIFPFFFSRKLMTKLILFVFAAACYSYIDTKMLKLCLGEKYLNKSLIKTVGRLQ